MPSYSTLSLLLVCVASAAVIPRDASSRLDTPESSNVLKIIMSDPRITSVPDLSVQMVIPTSTDVRGTSNNPTNLSVDITPVHKAAFSIQALTPDMITTDKFLFSVTLAAFLDAKKARIPPSLDWNDDGCSHSEDFPGGFNFLNSCQRHDFGYSNYKRQGRFTEENREKLDDNFLADLNRECDKQSFFPGVACKATAVVYHTAVRSFGNL